MSKQNLSNISWTEAPTPSVDVEINVNFEQMRMTVKVEEIDPTGVRGYIEECLLTRDKPNWSCQTYDYKCLHLGEKVYVQEIANCMVMERLPDIGLPFQQEEYRKRLQRQTETRVIEDKALVHRLEVNYIRFLENE